MNVKVLILALFLPLAAHAQGFAGLGTSAEGFAVPQRGTALRFPADHGAHPNYRIEWWYLTANLKGADGRDYGVQWTLFRSALAPAEGQGWSAPQLWMGHAALTTPDGHHFAERMGRGGIGQAGATAQPFSAWIDDWQLSGDWQGEMRVTARAPDFAYDLRLSSQGPLIFHGDNGFSVKSREGQASYYYSHPFLQVAGTLTLPAGDMPVTGSAWIDREWSSQPLSDTQTGWDWVSLHFDDGTKLMGFRLRETGGANFTSGTWIAADGTTRPIPDGKLSLTPLQETEVAGRSVPTNWRVEMPERGLDVEISAMVDTAWMGTIFPYWEGPVTVTGSHPGRGYLEMTGYD